MFFDAKLGIYRFINSSGLYNNQYTAVFSAGLPYVQTRKAPKGFSFSI